MENEPQFKNIAVLGAGIARKHTLEPGYDGKFRVAAAAQLAKYELSQGAKVRLILLGGKSMISAGINSPEAEVMESILVKRYKLKRDNVFFEKGDKSLNTVENFLELSEIISGEEVRVITNTYHQKRAQLILTILRNKGLLRGKVIAAESILLQASSHYLPAVKLFEQSSDMHTKKLRELFSLAPTFFYALIQSFK